MVRGFQLSLASGWKPLPRDSVAMRIVGCTPTAPTDDIADFLSTRVLPADGKSVPSVRIRSLFQEPRTNWTTNRPRRR